MKKFTVKEILSHPELSQYITPQNCALFLLKSKDFEEVANVANASITDAYQRVLENMEGQDIEEVLAQNNDAMVTSEYAKSINQVFRDYHSKLNTDKLMLYMGYTASIVLQAYNRATIGKSNREFEEIFFENGDNVAVNGTDIRADIAGCKPAKESDVRNRLARVVLIAAKYFNENKQKNKKYFTEINGNFYRSGIYQRVEKIRFNEKELTDFARSAELLSSMSNEALAGAISEGLVQKNTLLKHLEKGKIEKKAAVDFMEYGVISQEDFVKRVYGKKNMTEVAQSPETDPMTKLILFNNNKISKDTFKEVADFSLAFKAYIFKTITIEEFQDLITTRNLTLSEDTFEQDWNMVAVAYSDRPKQEVITDISELLTHNVFDYTQSMNYLRYMQGRKIISEEDRKYIEQLVQDFKIDELVNSSENKLIDVGGEGGKRVQSHVANLTIDPQVRLEYLKSLGSVKKLMVRGETFIKDSPEMVGKRNSLDGYEMFVIPSKKIAILEKFYETTRDKKGNIQYRRNKKGELIPSIENATYIMPIEMAKEFTENKNKRDLIKSPYVERSMHTADWTVNTERRIRKIRPEVQFDREQSKKWADKVRENYSKNKERNERTL